MIPSYASSTPRKTGSHPVSQSPSAHKPQPARKAVDSTYSTPHALLVSDTSCCYPRPMSASFPTETPPGFRGLDPELPVRIYRRHLPHWRQDGATYFVTFRQEDALPQTKLRDLRQLRQQWEELHPTPRSESDWTEYARQFTRRVEHWLDQGYGSCLLARPAHAQIVVALMRNTDPACCALNAFVLMPNHVHVLVRPRAGHTLESVVGSWKRESARRINRAELRRGALWEEESYDRIVRDAGHLRKVVAYMGNNPHKAGLAPGASVRWVCEEWEKAGWGFEACGAEA